MQDAIILYENGKAIGGEGHPTNADEITFDNTGTDLVSENVEDAIKEVNEKTSGLTQMTKLWENQSPTASFASQPISLSSDDYDFLDLFYQVNIGGTRRIMSQRVPKRENTLIEVGSGQYSRVITYSSDTSLLADSAYVGSTVNNNVCVPYIIYGIKII